MRTAFVILLALCLVVSCKKKKEPVATAESTQTVVPVLDSAKTSKAKTELIRYGRTPCFGMCPYFNLTVFESGEAVYEGKNFVDLIGIYHTTFDAASLQIIFDKADSIGYFGFDNQYDNTHVTDLPTITTGLYKNGKMKLVENRYKGPKELKELYTVLDELIKNAEWKPASRQ